MGIVCDTFLAPRSALRVSFALPESSGGEFRIEATVGNARAISVGGRGRFRCGVTFAPLARAEEQVLSHWIVLQLERTSKTDIELRTVDPTAQFMLAVAKVRRVPTIWDRAQAMQPQCAFGELGICCRVCLQGPCRIDPFGTGAKAGICGASADTMVVRNLARMIAGGTAAHVEHARHIVDALRDIGEHETSSYRVADEGKLRRIAERLGVGAEGASARGLAAAVAGQIEREFFTMHDGRPAAWLQATLTPLRLSRLASAGLLPADLCSPIVDLMHRTNTGVDTNPTSLLMAGIRCSLADYAGMRIATDISDVIFGVPSPRLTTANLAVIEADAVNVAVHGHNPLVSEAVCRVAREMNEEAVRAGAPRGINVVGVCCTGHEVLMRHGIPLAANFASQELAIMTGALDAMVVDYQCIQPGLSSVAECFHTRVVTTLPMGRLPDSPAVVHLELDVRDPLPGARRILGEALAAFTRRDPGKVSIPTGAHRCLVGFGVEAILAALGKVNPQDPLQPLIAAIAQGDIQGLALLCGCNNALVRQDDNILKVARGLLGENVLVLATGCSAGALAKAGLMAPEATEEHAGARLKPVLRAIGEAAGLEGALPPVLHLGSCVDNSRAVDVAVAVAARLNVDLDRLPVVASAPELMAEKAVAIGTWAMALGLPVHLGIIPPVFGAPDVVSTLTQKTAELVGGHFIFELNPHLAVDRLLEVIRARRTGLGL
ncbi:MAG: anaerobic carbon-monoxide dehydrogenase catalytic subunit [Deltaproteobacteria bacterium]|nr:anaerobic carbon-monoxide dehydrogenase catalytic subunit [Deltaproteobacteria bacterium]